MIKRLFAVSFVIFAVSFGAGILRPNLVAAACEDPFLTFRPWYTGLVDGSCTIVPPEEDDLPAFIWTIILNVLNILFNAIGYLALGLIIYGGYLYVLARGDATRIAKGKRTVMAAVIGLIICILASLISSTIVGIITEATGAA